MPIKKNRNGEKRASTISESMREKKVKEYLDQEATDRDIQMDTRCK
jgi:hypothetical protein